MIKQLKEMQQKYAILEIALGQRDSEATAYEEECNNLRVIIEEVEKHFKNVKQNGCNVVISMHKDRYLFLQSLFKTVF